MSVRELEQGRQIEDVVRLGHVRRISPTEITLDGGSIRTDPRQVHVDCTACGVRATAPRPLFEDGRVTVQYVTVGVIPWSSSIVGYVEATRDDDAEKNRLCPPVVFSGWSADLLDLARSAMTGMVARAAEPDIAAWSDASRLNPAGGVAARRDDPHLAEAAAMLYANVGPALQNLERTASVAGADRAAPPRAPSI